MHECFKMQQWYSVGVQYMLQLAVISIIGIIAI